jgi:hypothetical protein
MAQSAVCPLKAVFFRLAQKVDGRTNIAEHQNSRTMRKLMPPRSRSLRS